MKDKLEQRLKQLETKRESQGDLHARDYYELAILQSLYDDKGTPNYDDLEDFKNIEVALDKVKALLIQTVQNYYSHI